MKKQHRTNRRYSAEFKIHVILDMRNNHLGYNETVYKYWDVKNSVGSCYQQKSFICSNKSYVGAVVCKVAERCNANNAF